MKRILSVAVMALVALSGHAQKQSATAGGYPISPVPFTSVKVTPGTFWGQRLEASRNVTVPLAFSKCESEGRYKNFENAAAHLKDPSKVFKVNGVGYSFDDTDPYKTIEGASYLLQTYPDKKLRHYVDSVIDIIATAQEPDGYLYTARTQNPANPNWKDNVRLAMYLIEKLNEKVPGVTLGISLRKDTKYNTTATQFGLLAEIGFEGNLAPEADRTAALLGTVLGEIFA